MKASPWASFAFSRITRVGGLAALTMVLLCTGLSPAESATPAPHLPISRQMQALWQGQAHFQEVRDIDWAKPPYNTFVEGAGWFAEPLPLPDGKWYLFSRHAIQRKPNYCPGDDARVVVRVSSDHGRTWSTPGVVAATPGAAGAPDACGIFDGATYFDRETNTWHMLAQCLAAHNAGGWSMCHYVRRGSSPMGQFEADRTPAVTSGELWARICANSHGACDPRRTHDEGTPEIIQKKSGYFYVTFHGFAPPLGFRGIAKTADFHNWIVTAPDLPGAPIFAPPECRAWNPGCVGAGEASTLIAGKYQYMLIETPSVSLLCTAGQTWPIALMRAPKGVFPPWFSRQWEIFPHNPLIETAWPSKRSKCAVQYPRWVTAANKVYILYEDFDYRGSQGAPKTFRRRLVELVPGAGPSIALSQMGSQ